MQFPSVIFRKYDIRGTVTGDSPQVTPELARAVGMGYGTYMRRTFQTERVYVGCDNRPTSPMLKAALIEGLLSTGLDVTDLGQVMTPTVYYASAQHGARGGGIQITGSHLSLQFNGIKMAYDRFALYGDQIQEIRKLIEADDFERGNGTLTCDDSLVKQHMQTIASKVRMGSRKLKIVLDAGNSLSGVFMQPVYEQLGVEVICLYCEPDGTFPNHLPNPEDPETTKDLERAVLENGADMGIGFDGDADRCGIIDEHGHHIAADRLLALLARDLLSRHKGAKIVFDVKASQALEDEIRAHGGIPIMWKTGHSLMKAKMAEEGAPLGGEVSGHLFIGEDYYGFDDAPLVSLKVLEIFSKETRTVSEVFDSIPKLVATPEIIVHAPDDRKFQIIEALQNEFAAEHPVITLDGARVTFDHGWGLVRASNTQPAITMRFEARTKADLVAIMQDFDRRLAHYPEVARDKLQEQIAAFSA
ncbi:MAG: phosphomannomutase [Candidatus Thermofonsia Clade 1 bacterium]|uniref:Phosphomannomutase n=1 Tax=Candidatus Thermofonsia Clade 1 bacterium TaxID=2364210 RepID=A0A2M8NZF0_9CHLR|nr:MAG: phosphomannomutase [Candidatus Thermofonsia Clade 1 bacterium]